MTVPSELPPGPGEDAAAQMAADWQRGECHRAEEYLAQQPELLAQPEGVVRLIYEEVCLREERGEEVALEELLGRFPTWGAELAVMLDCHRLVRARLAPPEFPIPGESLGDFQLLAELGRGQHGRVFLATQPALADRTVVLKVTPRHDHEFLSLARLQHTHIIPLHGVHDFPARNLRGLCQPFLGGATLARILELLRPIPVAQRTGQSIVDALDRAPLDPRARLAARGGYRPALVSASYVEAVCWIGACLADGLQYAHARGIIHHDLKPANVLLAADGQPLLLDFHLALHPLPAGQPAPEWFGGTPGYMSPEQEAGCVAARLGKPVPCAVDERSDIYSLGCLLYAALAGEEVSEPRPPLRHYNPRVSVGLADLLRRCLAAQPAERYPSAAAVADDLRRHLGHRPLRGVSNRSLWERWRKWVHRRPAALVWAGLLLALAVAAGVLATGVIDRRQEAQAALVEGQRQMRRGAYREAARTLIRGREKAGGLPGNARLLEEIDGRLRQARRARAARELREVADRLRLLAGAEIRSSRELAVLDGNCRRVWAVRGLVADRTVPLDPDTEAQVKADLLDLLLFWADLHRRGGSGGEIEALLSQAEAILGPSPALAHQRDPRAPLPPARSWWEHLALGQSLLRSGELDRSAEELERAIDLRPQNLWAHFARGVCTYRQGRYAEAVHSFGVAIALAPGSAEVYHNRALAYSAWGKPALALRDYNRALELAPNLGVAALHRGRLHYQEGRQSRAREDLHRALRHGVELANPEARALAERLGLVP